MTIATLDLAAVKARQQATWASGNYAAVATRIQVVAELLCDAADLVAGSHVLDVAAGSGNATLAAARFGARVTGLDYVPQLLARARARAEAEGLPVELVEGDAEQLPFATGTFDATVSVFGVMFAPDHDRAAAELVRVTRPGGTIALAAWTPDGFIGGVLRTVGRHLPPPSGLRSPILWGTPEHVRGLLGDGVETLQARVRTYRWRFASAAQFVEFFRINYGPTLKAFEALGEAGEELERDLIALASEHGDVGPAGTITIPSTYLEVVARLA